MAQLPTSFPCLAPHWCLETTCVVRLRFTYNPIIQYSTTVILWLHVYRVSWHLGRESSLLSLVVSGSDFLKKPICVVSTTVSNTAGLPAPSQPSYWQSLDFRSKLSERRYRALLPSCGRIWGLVKKFAGLFWTMAAQTRFRKCYKLHLTDLIFLTYR